MSRKDKKKPPKPPKPPVPPANKNIPEKPPEKTIPEIDDTIQGTILTEVEEIIPKNKITVKIEIQKSGTHQDQRSLAEELQKQKALKEIKKIQKVNRIPY